MSGRVLELTFLAAAFVLSLSIPAEGQYVDTSSSCMQCHEMGLRQNDFCASVSPEMWLQDDKHRRAFYLLHESDPTDPERGAAKRALVRQILGFELAEAFTDGRFLRLKRDADAETVRRVAVVKACLRCHATWPKAADAEFSHEAPVPLELGVSCQACHGPGEKWDAPHRLVAWRAVTPAAKAALGFFDCRSSAAKSRLCMSCHVGNIEEDKFVRHEWYAAGHPPLPGFELASFQMQMPRHWNSLAEKGDFAFRARPPSDDSGQLARQVEALKRSGVPAEAIKASYLEANCPEAMSQGVDPGADLAATKDTVIGGVVLLETHARLLADYAEAATQGSAAWPELALYDCAACHHELRGGLPSSRPVRRHGPGRPPLAMWTRSLAVLAVQQGNSQTELQPLWLELERAITATPFGDAGQVASAADALAKEAAVLADTAAATAFDNVAARRALVTLTSGMDAEVYDFATARQTAWALMAIMADLNPSDARRLFDAHSSDPLALSLPSGPGRSVMENLRRWLPAAAQFDPLWFSAQAQAARTLGEP